jgi:hypothetical protein
MIPRFMRVQLASTACAWFVTWSATLNSSMSLLSCEWFLERTGHPRNADLELSGFAEPMAAVGANEHTVVSPEVRSSFSNLRDRMRATIDTHENFEYIGSCASSVFGGAAHRPSRPASLGGGKHVKNTAAAGPFPLLYYFSLSQRPCTATPPNTETLATKKENCKTNRPTPRLWQTPASTQRTQRTHPENTPPAAGP